MAFFHIFSNNEGRPVLLLDIGSESVGGALIIPKGAGSFEVVATHREYIAPGLERHPKRLLTRSQNALKETCKVLDILRREKKNIPSPRQCSILILPPWYIAMTRIIHADYEKSTVMTESIVQKLLKKEVDTTRAELGSKDKEMVTILEEKILEFRLNGYQVDFPLHKTAKRLEIILLLALTSDDFGEKLIDSVHKVFSGVSVHFSSLPTVAGVSTRNGEDEGASIIVEVSGEVTELILIRHGVVAETVSFPSGRNELLRSLARGLKTDALKVAASRLRLHKEGGMTATDEKSYKEFSEQWSFLFHKSLSRLGEQAFVPRKIYLIDHDKEIASLFSELIKNEHFSQFSREEEGMDLHLLSEKITPIQNDLLLGMHMRAFNQTLTLPETELSMVHSIVSN